MSNNREQENEQFKEIIQGLESDETFIRQTGKISRTPVGGRALILGIIMTLVGVCMVPVALALLSGFWALVVGTLAFALSVWGAMITHGAWGTTGIQNVRSVHQGKFMQNMQTRWDKHVKESGR